MFSFCNHLFLFVWIQFLFLSYFQNFKSHHRQPKQCHSHCSRTCAPLIFTVSEAGDTAGPSTWSSSSRSSTPWTSSSLWHSFSPTSCWSQVPVQNQTRIQNNWDGERNDRSRLLIGRHRTKLYVVVVVATAFPRWLPQMLQWDWGLAWEFFFGQQWKK